MTARQRAALGLFHLEEVVLDVLSIAGPLEPGQISDHIGIRRLIDEKHNTHYGIVQGVLIKLKEEGRVERCENSDWKLTERERLERDNIQ